MKARFAAFQPIRPERHIWGREYRHDACKARHKLSEQESFQRVVWER